MSFVGLAIPDINFVWIALVAAVAATCGRIVLAKASYLLLRRRWLSEETRRNVDTIRVGIESRPVVTFSTVLGYALSPLPSNYLFIAYGLTSLQSHLWLCHFSLDDCSAMLSGSKQLLQLAIGWIWTGLIARTISSAIFYFLSFFWCRSSMSLHKSIGVECSLRNVFDGYERRSRSWRLKRRIIWHCGAKIVTSGAFRTFAMTSVAPEKADVPGCTQSANSSPYEARLRRGPGN